MTTFAAFVTGLGNLTITGVTRKFAYPPTSLPASDLPAQWVQMPKVNEDAMTFQAHGGWPRFTAQLIIAYKPVTLDTQSVNWSAIVGEVDSVRAALAAAVLTFSKAKVTWSAGPGVVAVGGADYWAVIAEIETYG